LGVAQSALKRGIPYEAILHVAHHGDLIGADSDGLIWWIGTTPTGQVLEVAGFDSGDGAIVIVHAFPTAWRKK